MKSTSKWERSRNIRTFYEAGIQEIRNAYTSAPPSGNPQEPGPSGSAPATTEAEAGFEHSVVSVSAEMQSSGESEDSDSLLSSTDTSCEDLWRLSSSDEEADRPGEDRSDAAPE